MTRQTDRRVVITGIGAIAPNGIGKEAFWQATRNGISGIGPLQRISKEHMLIRVAGEVQDFVASTYIDRKLANRTDRATHFVFAAVEEALQDAHLLLSQEQPERVGTVIANTVGGMEYVLKQFQALYTRGPRAMSAYTAIAWLQVANVGQTSIRYGLQGYCKTPTNDTLGSLDALGIAYRAIRRDAADIIITGGCEAPLDPTVLLVMAHSGYCLTSDEPCAYRPFDVRAAGVFPAEGAGICILEDYEHARQRGAAIYGEIVGYGQTNDAHGLYIPSSDGRHYARAIRLAMQDGNVQPQDVSYFSATGWALPAADMGEAEALHSVFGSDLTYLPISVPRTMLGHSYAAAGVLDTITALLSLQHGLIPPTINCEEPDPCYELDIVRHEARLSDRHAVLIGGRAMGGANGVLALRRGFP
jgi:3-oxoacyl-(acyl-carrier-protein) synthase